MTTKKQYLVTVTETKTEGDKHVRTVQNISVLRFPQKAAVEGENVEELGKINIESLFTKNIKNMPALLAKIQNFNG